MRNFALSVLTALAGAATACERPTAAAEPPAAQSRVVLERQLPGGPAQPYVRMVEVIYPPGGASAAHSHPCPVVALVLEGAVRTKVNDAPEAIHRAGETFVEAAGDVHAVSANASDTERARFIATFTCAAPHTVYSTPIGARSGS
jgi:quercetin dioxygenase-like cupin family protein